MSADDKLNLVLEQYDLDIKQITRMAGGIYLDTNLGSYLLKQRTISENRVVFEEEVKELLTTNGYENTDRCLKNIDNYYVTEGMYGETYTCKKNYYGLMCELDNPAHLKSAAVILGELHNRLEGYTPTLPRKERNSAVSRDSMFYIEKEAEIEAKNSENKSTDNITENMDNDTASDTNLATTAPTISKDDIPYVEGTMEDLFNKRLGELRRTYKYLKKIKNPYGIEQELIELIPHYIKECEKTIKELDINYDKALFNKSFNNGNIIHGSFSGHNIYFNKDYLKIIDGVTLSSNKGSSFILENAFDNSYVIGYEKSRVGASVHDLYLFIRKVGEKNQWNSQLLSAIIELYTEVHPLNDAEKSILISRLQFPEKFWKAVNMYFNGKKSWTPGRAAKKLSDVCDLKDSMDECLVQIYKMLR